MIDVSGLFELRLVLRELREYQKLSSGCLAVNLLGLCLLDHRVAVFSPH